MLKQSHTDKLRELVFKEWQVVSLLLVFIIAEIIVNPFREHSLNDDWSYAKSVLILDEEHRLYWDGNRVEVRNRLSLTLWQRVGAVIIAGSTFVGALAAVASAIADWKAL